MSCPETVQHWMEMHINVRERNEVSGSLIVQKFAWLTRGLIYGTLAIVDDRSCIIDPVLQQAT